jgi:hypothetical protein
MLQTACQIYDIQVVTHALPCNGDLKVTFQSGLVATLPANHPDQEIIRDLIQDSLLVKTPLGILIDTSGQITELNYTYESTVRYVGDDTRPDRLLLGFWAYSAVCYLMRDHPEFERIQATLTEAARSGSRVVFANYMWPAKDGTNRWLKILDVRPLPPLPPDRSLNGVLQDPATSRYNQPSWPNP